MARFLNTLDTDSSLTTEAKKLIRDTWEKCQDCDADEFLTQGLALLSAEFRAGLDAYDTDRFEQCAGVMEGLRASSNPFIATHAAVYEIKSLVAMERLLEAGRRIEELLGRANGIRGVETYSYLAPEVAFLRGFCLLSDLRYDEAEESLSGFLKDYPEASPRLVLAARQMLAELSHRQPGRIGEVVDLMNYATRRLTHGDAGEPVQDRQRRIVDILDRLIEEAQERERSGGGSSGSGQSGGGDDRGSSGGQLPSSPMQDSRLPGGGPPEGPLQDPRRVNPGEVWGSMPPAERERILQALRDSFPGRYRQLVEQYYEQLAKKP